ncbi:MAG: DUF456 domain-containing protein [Pirellulales bacterium]|nr:DUF456 domain-containing protein [Pirellulales bacterium]
MSIVYAILLILVLMCFWLLTVVGMPGNWMMVAATALYAWLVPEDAATSLGWGVVLAVALLAGFGELLEAIAGALGVAKAGGSRRGAVLALLGSLAGGIVGMFVGLPIPVVGPLVAAVLFAGTGALIGAMLGEQWKGRNLDESWAVGKGAFWGRLLGTLSKVFVGSIMIVIVGVALVF